MVSHLIDKKTEAQSNLGASPKSCSKCWAASGRVLVSGPRAQDPTCPRGGEVTPKAMSWPPSYWEKEVEECHLTPHPYPICRGLATGGASENQTLSVWSMILNAISGQQALTRCSLWPQAILSIVSWSSIFLAIVLVGLLGLTNCHLKPKSASPGLGSGIRAPPRKIIPVFHYAGIILFPICLLEN